MNEPETKSRAGADLTSSAGSAAEVKQALARLVGDITEKLKAQEERLTMLDRKSIVTRRPALSTAAEQDAPHQKAFEAYVRSGDDDGLRGLPLAGKAMTTAIASEGGYLVDPQTSETIRSVLHSSASIRRVANVVTVDAVAYDVLVDFADMGSGWATETGVLPETDTPAVERITIPLHELSALPKASQRLLDDAAFDIEGWLAERIAEKFARSEAAAFVLGDGIDKPTGFLHRPAVSNDDWSWGALGYIATGAAGSFGDDAGDTIVDLVYSLGARYRANGAFVMNSKTTGAVRKLKDADGRFLWSDGLQAGEPARLMGYPVVIAEDMPDYDQDGALAIAFGDFDAGYTVAERPDLRILRDPFSAKPHVLFYATKRVGGDVSDFAAIKLLKFGAS
jgi:HK97 family phage major capsid protein